MEAEMTQRRTWWWTAAACAVMSLVFAGCASAPLSDAAPRADAADDSKAKTFTAPASTALIYVVRNGGYISGSYQLFRVTLDGHEAGALADKTYFVFTVQPGRHVIKALGENEQQVEIQATANAVYFVGLSSRIGMATARVNASLLPTEEGKAAVTDAKLAIAK
jgi:hypothetical protein